MKSSSHCATILHHTFSFIPCVITIHNFDMIEPDFALEQLTHNV